MKWQFSFEPSEPVGADRARLQRDFPFLSVCNLYWQSNLWADRINRIFPFSSYCSVLEANNFSGAWFRQS